MPSCTCTVWNHRKSTKRKVLSSLRISSAKRPRWDHEGIEHGTSAHSSTARQPAKTQKTPRRADGRRHSPNSSGARRPPRVVSCSRSQRTSWFAEAVGLPRSGLVFVPSGSSCCGTESPAQLRHVSQSSYRVPPSVPFRTVQPRHAPEIRLPAGGGGNSSADKSRVDNSTT